TLDDDYGDLRLSEESAGVDYGLTALLPPDVWDLDGDGDFDEPLPLDVAGQPRVVGQSVDAGAHEGAVAVASEPGPGEAEALGLAVHPSPARGAAAIVLTLPQPSEVSVGLYDVLGRRVAVLAEGRLTAGRHEVPLEASSLPPGVYVARVAAGREVAAAR